MTRFFARKKDIPRPTHHRWRASLLDQRPNLSKVADSFLFYNRHRVAHLGGGLICVVIKAHFY